MATGPSKAMPKLRGKRRMLTFSLPPELISMVEAKAAKERRSRANMIEAILRVRYNRVLAPQPGAAV